MIEFLNSIPSAAFGGLIVGFLVGYAMVLLGWLFVDSKPRKSHGFRKIESPADIKTDIGTVSSTKRHRASENFNS